MLKVPELSKIKKWKGSSQDALSHITEEDRQFLLLQREKGRTGCMGGIDLKCVKAEQRKKNRQAAKMKKLEKSKEIAG